jgi:hypothetical protein
MTQSRPETDQPKNEQTQTQIPTPKAEPPAFINTSAGFIRGVLKESKNHPVSYLTTTKKQIETAFPILKPAVASYFSGIKEQASTLIPQTQLQPPVHTPLGIKEKSFLAAFLNLPFVQKHETFFTGVGKGLFISFTTFGPDRLVTSITLSDPNAKISDIFKNMIIDPSTKKYSMAYAFKGLGPSTVKSAIQLGVFTTTQPIFADFFSYLNPEIDPKVAIGVAAGSSRLSVYWLGAVEYARTYRNMSYTEILKMPISDFHKGAPAATLRDIVSFPLFYKTKEQMEKLINIEHPGVKATVVGGVSAGILFPLTNILTMISNYQKRNPEKNLSFYGTFQTLFKENGMRRFYQGGAGSIFMLFFFGAMFNLSDNFIKNAKAENLIDEQEAEELRAISQTKPGR